MSEKKRPDPAHLSSLFTIGTEVTVKDVDGNEYTMWLARPSSVQQEEARERANAKMARYKYEVRDKEGDRYLAIAVALDRLSHDELTDHRVAHQESDLREQAINEVLYGEFGSDWSTDDAYYALIQAITDRFDEISKYNESMRESGSGDRIDLDSDEELNRLVERQDQFTAETESRFQELLEQERAKHRDKTVDELREEVINLTIDLESKMAWYETYQIRMLYYAVRYIDDHKKFYFESSDDVLEIPSYIRQQLYQSYELLDAGSGDLKNSLSLLRS